MYCRSVCVRPVFCLFATVCVSLFVEQLSNSFSSLMSMVLYMVAIMALYTVLFWCFGVEGRERVMLQKVLQGCKSKLSDKIKDELF